MLHPSINFGAAKTTTKEGCVFRAVEADAKQIANLPNEFATCRHSRRPEAARNTVVQSDRNHESHESGIEPARNSAVQGNTTDTQFHRRWRFFIIATAVVILMA